MNTPVPLDDPALLISDILPIVTTRFDTLPFMIHSFEGTGFLLANNVIVTCSHCIEGTPPEYAAYGAVRFDSDRKVRGNLISQVEQIGNDLAFGHILFDKTLAMRLAETTPVMGAAVWTFGYPLTDVRRITGEFRTFVTHPRLLRGHITRDFLYNHATLGRVPSWELSFAAPEGLSGAPLFLESTLDVIGIVYGNNDVATVEQAVEVNADTGERTPEIQRIVSFGLAVHLQALAPLAEAIEKQT